MRERTQQVTIRVTAGQLSNWESSARMFNRDLPRFIVLAANLYARRLREMHWQRVKRDPIGQRLQEKVLLGRLLDAARAAVEHVPAEVHSHTYGLLKPRRDLRDAIDSVRRFLAETGEEYGPCP